LATGLIKSKSRDSVGATIDKLARNVRRVLDYLRMTGISVPRSSLRRGEGGWNRFALRILGALVLRGAPLC
jgi:hypothetical protein